MLAKKLRGSNAARGTLYLGAAAAFTLAGNVAFHAIVARGNGAAGYSLTGALLAFGSVASVLGAGIQYAIARRTARAGAQPVRELVTGARALLPWIIAAAAALGLCSPLADYLHVGSALPVIDAFGYFAATLALAVPTGVLVGLERFGTFAALTVAGVALRLALAVAAWGTHISGTQAVSSSTVATIMVAVLAAAAALRAGRRAGSPSAAARAEGGLSGESAAGAALGASIWAAWMLPLFFSRHYLDASTAGSFSAAQITATAVLFVAAPVTTAFFPTIARSRGRRPVLAGLGLTFAVCAAGVAGLVVLGPSVIPRLYGSGYRAPRELIVLLGTSVAVAALASYALWATRARSGSSRVLAGGALTALAAEVIIGAAWHHSADALAVGPGMSLVAGGAAAVPLLLARRRAVRRDLGTAHQGRPGRHLVPSAHTAGGTRLDDLANPLARMAVGVIAHNEAGTIRACVEAILSERSQGERIPTVVLVVSGSTDGTDTAAAALAAEHGRVTLISEPRRYGKAAALNRFLESTTEPLCALVSADTLPAPGALALMAHSLSEPGVGMCGGRVLPQNARSGLANRLVHLLWDLHNQVALADPKLGEVVAFRRSFDRIDPMAIADEVSIEAEVRASGGGLRYVPEAVVYNRGPERLKEYVRHRMRNHRGHLKVRSSSGYKASTLSWRPVVAACARHGLRHPTALPLLSVAAALEVLARVGGRTSPRLRAQMRDGLWEPITSAKQAFGPPDAEIARLAREAGRR